MADPIDKFLRVTSPASGDNVNVKIDDSTPISVEQATPIEIDTTTPLNVLQSAAIEIDDSTPIDVNVTNRTNQSNYITTRFLWYES